MTASADTEFDLPALGATLWRKKWKVIAPTVLVALLTLAVVQVITPRYQSETRVLIESRDNVYLRPDADKDNERGTVDQEAVTSQAQIILSRDLAREVIDKLKLGELPEFDPALAGLSPVKAVLGMLGLAKDPLSMTPEERVLEAYYDRLTVTPIDKSRVITIDFVSQDPELAARVANAIAEAYLVRQRQAKQEQAQSAGQWLAGQIESMRQKVEEAEAKAEDFRAKANLLIGTNNTTLSAQQLSDVNAQLAAAQAQKADAEAKARLIRDMLKSGAPIESSDILNSELLRRLAEQRVTLRAQLAEQSSTLLDNHPRIKELKAQIADLDSQIRAEAETIARSFENDSKLAGARLDSQTAMLDQLKNQAASTNGQDVQLRALERDAKSQRDLLESYLAKYQEATSRDTINSTPADARIISSATVSNIPAYPKKLPTVLIASFATLILSSGLVMTRAILAAPGFVPMRAAPGLVPARFEPAFASAPAGVADSAPVPSGLAPRVAAVLRGRPRADSASAFGAVSDVASDLEHGAAASIAVFAAAPGIHDSAAAIKLARALAAHARVILIGMADDDGAIAAISNEPSAGGLAELARGAASLGEIITRDQGSSLHLIAPGHSPADLTALLAAPGMITSLHALARSYDHLVIAAGVAADGGEKLAGIVSQAMVVADAAAGAAAAAARDRLLAAGFAEVMLVASAPDGVAAAA
jgi:uncharacterized protein involved in exopolysaccharide biosynthesis/Mrp family chromosome partitioning ATPase